MNIFMSSPSIIESVKDLDDKRLLKQIVECKTIYLIGKENRTGGYANHPVVKYYKDKLGFVAFYGYVACQEYRFRFDKVHSCFDFFAKEMNYTPAVEKTKPIYVEGAAGKPGSIRTTEYTVPLFRQKLISKWNTDKTPPKWTKREVPLWYQETKNN